MENEQNRGLEKVGMLYLTTLLDDMWRGFKKFFWLLFALIILCGSVFYLRSRAAYIPEYTAYASFVIQARTPYGYSESYSNKITAEQMSKTFPYILKSGALQQVVMENLGMKTMPVTINAESTADTALFTLSVTGEDPQMTYDVLQSVIENYPVVAEYIIGTTQLTQMDESGVPTEPSNSPDDIRQAKIGILTGVVLFTVFLFLYAMGRRTVRREEDLKNRFSIPMLGSIPMIHHKKRRKSQKQKILITNTGDMAGFSEPIRTIRMRLLKETKEKKIKVLMVTSAIAGEGKSTTAVNLALSMAQKGMKVVLVDGDLRNPSVASVLGMNERLGISHLLKEDAELQDVLKIVGESDLMVIPGSEKINNPTELISSVNMQKLISKLKELSDYIIIDTPPCTSMSDASLFARVAQGIVMVVRQDYAHLEKVVSGFEIMVETGTPVVGYVLDCTEVGITGYGNGYGYGYGYGYGKYGYGKYGYGKYGYGQKKDRKKEEVD